LYLIEIKYNFIFNQLVWATYMMRKKVIKQTLRARSAAQRAGAAGMKCNDDYDGIVYDSSLERSDSRAMA
jgi:hypothetical protein